MIQVSYGIIMTLLLGKKVLNQFNFSFILSFRLVENLLDGNSYKFIDSLAIQMISGRAHIHYIVINCLEIANHPPLP